MSSILSRRLDVSARRWMYLPISVQLRETDGNALLAFEAAERGWGVILGHKLQRNRPDWPCGIVIEKDISPGQTKESILAWQARGGKASAWGEEGLVYHDAEQYGRRKIDPKTYELLDSYYCWGQNEADDLVGKLGCSADKIRVTGNPRFDLHRADLRVIFDRKVQCISRKYAPFILINTKFSSHNNYDKSEKRLAKMRSLGGVHQGAQGLVEFQAAGFAKFMELIEELSRRFPAYSIVVRPHPMESHDPWRAKAATLPNVKVVYEGNVIEWILASEVCIHSNCMTGVEAYLLGKPAIAYRPVCDERFDLFLPNALSTQAFNLEDLVGLVAAAVRGEELSDTDSSPKVDITRHFIANATGKRACEEIMDALASTDLPEVPLSLSGGLLGDLRARVGGFVAPMKRRSGDVGGQQFGKHKFPGLHSAELMSLLEMVRQATGRFRGVRVSKCGENVFCIC